MMEVRELKNIASLYDALGVCFWQNYGATKLSKYDYDQLARICQESLEKMNVNVWMILTVALGRPEWFTTFGELEGVLG